MEEHSFNNHLEMQLATLSYEKQLLFCIRITKDLFPEYKQFCTTNHWGDPDTLIDAIRLCENTLQKEVGIPELKNAISDVNEVTPDMDDFGDWQGSYALNACTSLMDTLEFTIDKDLMHLQSIATYYTDTIDFKIRESGIEDEKEIDEHPMLEAARDYLLKLAT